MQPLVAEDSTARTERLTGRVWALERVQAWLDSSASALLMVAEPGWGKTAFAAWLAGAGPLPVDESAKSSLESLRRAWHATHFCRAEQGRGSVNPARFAQSVAKQLANTLDDFATAALRRLDPRFNIHVEARENWGEMIGARINNLITTETNVEDIYNRTVRDPLEEYGLAHPHERVLILVDGLDEALTVPSPNIVDLLAGSMDFAPNVRFALTSRDEPRVTSMFPSANWLNLSDPQYAAATDRDIRTYIEARLVDEVLAAQALEQLDQAQQTLTSVYAGFGSLAALSLATRYAEFGLSGAAPAVKAWMYAYVRAAHVRDPDFAEDRIALAQAYEHWAGQPVLDVEPRLRDLSRIVDRDMRTALWNIWKLPGRRPWDR